MDAFSFTPRMVVRAKAAELIRKTTMKVPISRLVSALPTKRTPKRVLPLRISETITEISPPRHTLNNNTINNFKITLPRLDVPFFEPFRDPFPFFFKVRERSTALPRPLNLGLGFGFPASLKMMESLKTPESESRVSLTTLTASTAPVPSSCILASAIASSLWSPGKFSWIVHWPSCRTCTSYVVFCVMGPLLIRLFLQEL